MAQATLAAEPLARHAGITLRIGTLWLAALRERAPLVAAFGRGVCQLGYSAFTPGRDQTCGFVFSPLRDDVLSTMAQHSFWGAPAQHWPPELQPQAGRCWPDRQSRGLADALVRAHRAPDRAAGA